MSTAQDWAHLLKAVDRQPNPAESADLLTAAIAIGTSLVPQSVGCSVTEVDADQFSTPIASGTLAMALDQAQYVAGIGPCVVAARGRVMQSIHDMTLADEFTYFSAAALHRGVHSSLSLPLAGTARPAAVNLCANAVGAFDDDAVRATAALLVRCVSALLPDAEPLPNPAPTSLAAAREQGAVVSRARDALAGTSPDVGFQRLTWLSRVHQRNIASIAESVLAADFGDVDNLGDGPL